jgi:hypothetical protein
LALAIVLLSFLRIFGVKMPKSNGTVERVNAVGCHAIPRIVERNLRFTVFVVAETEHIDG